MTESINTLETTLDLWYHKKEGPFSIDFFTTTHIFLKQRDCPLLGNRKIYMLKYFVLAFVSIDKKKRCHVHLYLNM